VLKEAVSVAADKPPRLRQTATTQHHAVTLAERHLR
jgi:hypothetical protein